MFSTFSNQGVYKMLGYSKLSSVGRVTGTTGFFAWPNYWHFLLQNPDVDLTEEHLKVKVDGLGMRGRNDYEFKMDFYLPIDPDVRTSVLIISKGSPQNLLCLNDFKISQSKCMGFHVQFYVGPKIVIFSFFRVILLPESFYLFSDTYTLNH